MNRTTYSVVALLLTWTTLCAPAWSRGEGTCFFELVSFDTIPRAPQEGVETTLAFTVNNGSCQIDAIIESIVVEGSSITINSFTEKEDCVGLPLEELIIATVAPLPAGTYDLELLLETPNFICSWGAQMDVATNPLAVPAVATPGLLVMLFLFSALGAITIGKRCV